LTAFGIGILESYDIIDLYIVMHFVVPLFRFMFIFVFMQQCKLATHQFLSAPCG